MIYLTFPAIFIKSIEKSRVSESRPRASCGDLSRLAADGTFFYDIFSLYILPRTYQIVNLQIVTNKFTNSY